jgi:C4-dicarboxylate-specific signal transduction histidine kinase
LISRLIHAAKAIFAPLKMMEEIARQERRVRQSQQQRVEAELKLKLSQQMASVQKMSALGEMAAGVAHEINNPLTVVSLAVSSLNEKIANGITEPAALQKDVIRIRNSSQRIAKIVGGLRHFSRDAGNDPLEPTPAKEILQETLQFCQQRFTASKIQLRTENIESTARIHCRSTQISQVLLSLLNNAHDAVLRSADPWVKVSIREQNGHVELCVTDSGPGIPSQVREKIFQPFFTTKEIGKGTGLGLSVAKGVIESQGGQLYLDESSPNTRFVIRFRKHDT